LLKTETKSGDENLKSDKKIIKATKTKS